MKRLRLVVLGTLASNPYAGMAWMHMQITAGLRRLGHDAYYLETTSTWPYDPVQDRRVCSSEYAVAYLSRVARDFGLGDHWAYRRSYSDCEWLGPCRETADALLREADAVFNIAGATRPSEDGLSVGNLIYYGTDPVIHELGYLKREEESVAMVEEHRGGVTYGENIGTTASPIPPLPGVHVRTRQPVLLDLWETESPTRSCFTTIGNWRQEGRDVEFEGETYLWSKHHEFLKFIRIPTKINDPIELATNLVDFDETESQSFQNGEERTGEVVQAHEVGRADRKLLTSMRWSLVDATRFSTDPWKYRDYVVASRGEFTVARDLNVRLRSGWFSERSACYLAAGRPVITQDTGFGTVLPTGEGLFAFQNEDDILAAFEAIARDYEKQSAAARAIAEEYFRAETVLARMLDDLGL